ncbi:cation:proton antiporter [Puerhibacterium puerhi]|uniref:cation:proton antiporter n=1 Tax=Puerhibacterium puerhi TaxID=2692623 RepID=UPI001356DA80|nr:sodium:proton antiporter [Puerhibacterium puerhi]
MDLLVIGAAAAVVIIAVTALAPRTGVAAPLILVLLGVAVSFLPFVPAIEIEPEWILAGVLPPLLYSTAVSMPTMDFRRDFAAIGGLSVVLVVITSLLLGLVFSTLVPGLGFAGGVALGAIVSPTDAVATSIVRRLGANPRVVTVLEGEGLLNDASALVLLRSAVAATAASVSLAEVVGDFLWAVVGAVVCGAVVGWLGLQVRRRVASAALSTAVSLVVPFVAYLPAEHVHASGLVSVVTAGLITGHGAARLRPQDRVAENANWHTVDMLLEGAVFLVMGLELFALVEDVRAEHGSLWRGAGIAALAAVIVLVVRSAYVAPLLWQLSRRARRAESLRSVLQGMQDRIQDKLAAAASDGGRTGGPGQVPAARARRVQRLLRRRAADIDYLTAKPLGPREGVLLVWAGMRGVVTLAAAQSLPAEFPHRSFVVLVAFGVAAGTLVVQGGTLPWVVKRLGLGGTRQVDPQEYAALRAVIEAAAQRLLDDGGLARADGTPYEPDVVARVRGDVVHDHATEEVDARETTHRFKQYRELRLRTIDAQRAALLKERSAGVHDSRQLERALDLLDAEQITLEMRRGPA